MNHTKNIQNILGFLIILIIITTIPSNAEVNYDHISVPHTITFGTPQTTDSGNTIGTFKTTNVYNFDLKDFPLDNLPSGGNSGKISSSEMVMASVSMDDWFFVNDNITLIWYKSSKILYTSNCGLSQSCTSFIGHFSWEINEPGYYHVEIITTRGYADIGFNVINSSKSALYPQPHPALENTPHPVYKIQPALQTTPQPTYNQNTDINLQQTKDIIHGFGEGIGIFFKSLSEGIVQGLRS